MHELVKWSVMSSILFFFIKEVASSRGDKSYHFKYCIYDCYDKECEGSAHTAFLDQQPFANWLLQWSCEDECHYECMWEATATLVNRGRRVPQFFGKWPFARWLGIQEPASCIFSLLNLLSHLMCLRWFRSCVSPDAPLFITTHIFALVCSNAWIWSSIFHARDLPFTEHMDYYCAFSLVLCSLCILVLRMLGCPTGWQLHACLAAAFAMFVQHIFYLGWVHFDYGYNMKVNLLLGALNGLGWLLWWLWWRGILKYAWKSGAYAILVGLTALLEIADFPPVFWVFDAHALWHLSTIPLPLLFYSFLIDDSSHLRIANKSLLQKML